MQRKIKNNKGEIIYSSNDIKTIILNLLSLNLDKNIGLDYTIESKQKILDGEEYSDIYITNNTNETTEIYSNIPTISGRLDIARTNNLIEFN